MRYTLDELTAASKATANHGPCRLSIPTGPLRLASRATLETILAACEMAAKFEADRNCQTHEADKARNKARDQYCQAAAKTRQALEALDQQ